MFRFFRTPDTGSPQPNFAHSEYDVIEAIEENEAMKMKQQQFADELGVPLEEAREARIKISKEYNDAHMVRGLSEAEAIENVVGKNQNYTKEQISTILRSVWGVDMPGVVENPFTDRTTRNQAQNLH